MTAYDPRGGLYVGGADFGVPAGTPPAMTPAELEELVRFEHPAKLLAVAELPGAAAVDGAAAYRTDSGTVRALRRGLRTQVAAAARELLAEGVGGRLPVPPGATIVALGDSITDDLLSWAEILREWLARARPDDAIAVVNAGVSGDTTADALRRLHGVAACRPELVVTMLGTNDCQRHGPAGAQIAAPDESARHLAAVADWLRGTGARLAWITPPPVIEERLARAVGARPFTLRDADVRAVARAVHALGDPVVDLHELFGDPPAGHLLMADGVHPTLAGQLAIARAVLAALGSGQDATASSASPQTQRGAGKP
ncbi:MAG TPA: GDSL-type esterase/lipase family protein [Solirubrobacteraceae bacterium]|jgi:lysophospholipase L1-like esterase|nr:GDSL-type esterase/lipase family protein [Solirubrobacteraceae bacterium]